MISSNGSPRSSRQVWQVPRGRDVVQVRVLRGRRQGTTGIARTELGPLWRLPFDRESPSGFHCGTHLASQSYSLLTF